ncbi:MAG: 3-dehydroquinate synthase [Candidatus Sericytochromatia bacterium]|nr:3-dehydroquinate synthase [Candidatus Sericytochromatia bacterium]
MNRCIVLTGYMGAGKTTVGATLAAQLGWDFIDTDRLIEQMAGRPVSEIFQEGETHFRLWERQAIATLPGRVDLVVATGGGAVLDEETRAILATLGPVVYLDAPVETLWQRVKNDTHRPLALNREMFAARHAVRKLLYRRFALSYATHEGDPQSVATAIAADLLAPVEQINVNLAERSYTITMAPGSLPSLPHYVGGEPGPCLLITDDGVPAWFLEVVMASLTLAGYQPHCEIVGAGERHKSLETAEKLFEACLRAGLQRRHPIISLGGGVVGDMAGFVAATYMRGVPFIQVPTTLLSQVDAAVGGKVGVNFRGTKNLVGAFYQPSAVLIDATTLLTLKARDYRAGLAEVVKYGLMADGALFMLLESEVARLADRPLALLNTLIARCCEIKARIVEQDEREGELGLREALNLGHTLAHALESVLGEEGLNHGEAVGLGLILETRIAVQRGLAAPSLLERIEELLVGLGLPTLLPPCSEHDVIDAARRDKKNQGAGVRMVLLQDLGKTVRADVTPNEILAALKGD